MLRIAYVWFDRAEGDEVAVMMRIGDKTELGNDWYPSTVKQIEGTMIGQWQQRRRRFVGAAPLAGFPAPARFIPSRQPPSSSCAPVGSSPVPLYICVYAPQPPRPTIPWCGSGGSSRSGVGEPPDAGDRYGFRPPGDPPIRPRLFREREKSPSGPTGPGFSPTAPCRPMRDPRRRRDRLLAERNTHVAHCRSNNIKLAKER